MFTNKTKQNKNLATLFKSVSQGHENQGNQGQTEIVGTHDINSLATGDVNFDEVSVRFLHCKVTKSSIVYSLEWSLHSGEENGVSGGRSI